MTDSGKTLLLVGASLRSELRWASRHLYAALVLTPIVVGMTYATASRFAEAIEQWQPSTLTVSIISVSLAACLVALSLSRASAEIYHIRRPESSLDALPVSASSHLHAALIIRLVRATVTAALILAAAIIIGHIDLKKAALLLPFVLLLATAQLLAALNWIHWNHRREKSSALAAIVYVALAATNAGMLVADFARGEIRLWLIAASAILIILLYFLLAFLHARWRASDLEYARRLKLTGRWNIVSLTVFQKRLGIIATSQLARDLQLTLRAFSSAVYVIAGLALLTVAMLVIALLDRWLPEGQVTALLDATWLPSVVAVKIACVIVTASLVSLVPVLIAYELPLMWVERAIGTTGLDIWKAKLWYARLVSIPAAPAVWAAAMMTARLPLNYSLPLLLECVWLWWMVSSMSGAFAFEIPTRAGLSIVLMATIGLSAGVISAMLWPVGLMVYGMAMHSLTARGRARTRYFLITEEE